MIIAGLATTGIALSLLMVAMPPAQAAGAYLCTGYTGCVSSGYSDYGYGQAGGTSYWGMYPGHNCTNYAAYRLTQNGVDASYLRGQGNAYQWGGVAESHGVVVDGTPAVGSIAWWAANSNGSGSSGHVAYVQSVSGNGVFVASEDNWGGDFHWVRFSPGGYYPTAFIHFKDLVVDQPDTVAAETNADGRIELFGVNTHQPDGQNNIYHKWQLSPGGSWSGWYGIPGYLTSIAAARNRDGRLEIFGANAHQADGQSNVYHAWQLSPGGSWSGWYGIAGYLTTVAAETNADGRIELFGTNSHQSNGQNDIYHEWQLSPGGSWSGWYGIPGYLTSIAAARNRDGRLEIFGANAHQPDGQSNVYHAWQLSPGGSWSGWYGIAGYLTSVGADTNADGRIELFGDNTHQADGQNDIYHCWQLSPSGSWSGWYGIPGYLTSVGAARNSDGRLEIFGDNAHQPDGQNNIYHAWQLSPGGSWSGWSGIAGYLG